MLSEVMLLTVDHEPQSPTFEGSLRPVVLESRCWVSTRATVLPGCRVGEGAIVAAGAVVAKDVAPWTIVAGCPARRVSDRSPEAQRHLPRYRRWFH